MLNAVVRWTLFFVALLLVGPLAWLCTSGLHATDGVTRVIPSLASVGVVWGLAMAALAVTIGASWGLLVGWFTTLRWGLFNAGVVLAWAASGTGRVDEMFRAVVSKAPGSSPLGLWSVEAAVVGALTLAIGFAFHLLWRRRFGGAIEHERLTRYDTGLGPTLVEWSILIGLAAGLAVLASWALVQSSAKGQVLAGVTLATLGASAIGTLLCERWGQRPLPYVVGVAIVIVASPLVAMGLVSGGVSGGGGGDALVRDANAQALVPLLRVTPLDWLAGALLGLPMGLSWGQSLHAPRELHASDRAAA
jgi:hypothetical protein